MSEAKPRVTGFSHLPNELALRIYDALPALEDRLALSATCTRQRALLLATPRLHDTLTIELTREERPNLKCYLDRISSSLRVVRLIVPSTSLCGGRPLAAEAGVVLLLWNLAAMSVQKLRIDCGGCVYPYPGFRGPFKALRKLEVLNPRGVRENDDHLGEPDPRRLPEWLNLRHLTTLDSLALDLDYWKGDLAADHLCRALTRLTRLHLRNGYSCIELPVPIRLGFLQGSLSKMSALQVLEMGPGIVRLGPAIQHVTALRTLVVDGNFGYRELDSLPEEISELTNLTRLEATRWGSATSRCPRCRCPSSRRSAVRTTSTRNMSRAWR